MTTTRNTMQKPLPKGWKMVKLGEVCKRVSEQILPTDSPDTEFTYIGLEHIESNTGNLSGINKENGNNIKSSKNKFQKSDILYGKLRPYLNKVWLADRDGICSTDIWVLRPIKNIANDYFISTFLKSKPVVGLLSSKTEGANLPRVKASYFDKLPIPLPPLPTQHKIVEILEEADNLRKLRRQADDKIKDLIPSLFVQMFGDPATNPKGWEVRKMGEVCDVRDGTHDTPQYQANGIPLITSKNLIGDNIDFENVQYISEEDHNKIIQRSLVENGDILFAMIGTIGNPVIVNANKVFSIKNVALLKFKNANLLINYYLKHLLNNLSVINKMTTSSRGVTQKFVSLNILRNFQIPLPPLPLQQEFAKLVEDIEADKTRQAESRKKLDELFNSLMQRAFTGELAV